MNPNGSPAYPFPNAQQALVNPQVQPGQSIYLKAGIHRLSQSFTSGLRGTEAQSILVTHAPNETASVDLTNTALVELGLNSEFVIFDGLEFFSSELNRESVDSGSDYPADIRIGGLNVFGKNIIYRNCRFHDIWQLGIWKSEQFRCIECEFLNFGYKAPDRWHGHPAYVQNLPGAPEMRFERCIFGPDGTGFRGYSKNPIANIGMYDSILAFNNALFGGNDPVEGMTADNNSLWKSALQFGYKPGIDSTTMHAHNNYHAGWRFAWTGFENPDVQNNVFVGLEVELEDAVRLTLQLRPHSSGYSGLMNHNTYHALVPLAVDGVLATSNLVTWRTATGYDLNSTLTTEYPASNVVRVYPCQYGKRKAHIAIYNWQELSEVVVSVDVEDGNYALRNPFAYDEQVVVAAVNGSLLVPMTGWSIAAPQGYPTPHATWDTRFAALVLETP